MNYYQTNLARTLALSMIVMAVALSVRAADVTAIYHNISGVPGYEVPGLDGTGFNFSTTSTFNLTQVIASGNGNWIFQGTAGNSMGTVAIVNGQLVARQGTPAPFAPGENYGNLNGNLGGINDNGKFAFRNDPSGATGPTIITSAGGVYSVVAQVGQPTGLAALPDSTWSFPVYRPSFANSEVVGFIAGFAGPDIDSTKDTGIVIGNQLIAREGATIPGMQVGGTMFPVGELSDSFVDLNGNGNRYIYTANLAGDGGAESDAESAIVDGNVVIQYNQFATGSANVQTVYGVHMDDAGNWFARGRNQDGQDWIIRNGVTIAAEAESVVTGGASVWTQFSAGSDQGFSIMTGNGSDDWLIGGWDNSGAGGVRNALLVLNGDIFARQGDPVDLDGNGLLDDDAFFGSRFYSAAITNDGTVYLCALIQNGMGTGIGAGFFVMAGDTTPIAGDFDGDGDVDGADFVAWQTNFPKTSGANLSMGDADGDGDVDGADFVIWQTNFPFTPGPGASPVPEPSAAWLCVAAAVLAGSWVRKNSARKLKTADRR